MVLFWALIRRDSVSLLSFLFFSHVQVFSCKILFVCHLKCPYEGHTISFQTFFVWTLLLIVHTWNSSLFRSNLLRLQCTCCTVPTTSRRPHGSPLMWACQWPSSQSLSSPQLSHNDSLWAYGITRSHKEQSLDYRRVEELSWCPYLVK